MGFEWTEDLSTGINEIDIQHQELISRLNLLLESCGRKNGKDEIGRFLKFLKDYVVLHFAAEEREMDERKYPGRAAHKAEHDQFRMTIDRLEREYTEYGASIHVVLMTVRTSSEWLLSHIKKTDREMASYLKRSQGA